jgi:hypothetical protein
MQGGLGPGQVAIEFGIEVIAQLNLDRPGSPRAQTPT